MKKQLCLFTAAMLCLAFLASCGKTKTVHEISDFDSVSRVTVEENSESDQSRSPSQGNVVVKDKKYTFEGSNLVILEVENQTDKDYSITVHGSYLDADGNVLKTESQTFDQYYAGYKNYFLFRPGITFDKFTYTLEFAEASENLYVKDIGFEFQGLYESVHVVDELFEQGDYTQYPGVMGQFAYRYTGNAEHLEVLLDWILFDEQGEIIFIGYFGPWLEPGQNFDSYQNWWLYHPVTDHFEWPEGWKGDITAITAVHGTSTDYPVMPPFTP